MTHLLAGLVLTMVVMLAGCTVSLSPSGSTATVSTSKTTDSDTTETATEILNSSTTTGTPTASPTISSAPLTTSGTTETQTATETATETESTATVTETATASPSPEYTKVYDCGGHNVTLGGLDEQQKSLEKMNFSVSTTSDETETVTVRADAYDAKGIIETQKKTVIVPAGETVVSSIQMDMQHYVIETDLSVDGCEWYKQKQLSTTTGEPETTSTDDETITETETPNEPPNATTDEPETTTPGVDDDTFICDVKYAVTGVTGVYYDARTNETTVAVEISYINETHSDGDPIANVDYAIYDPYPGPTGGGRTLLAEDTAYGVVGNPSIYETVISGNYENETLDADPVDCTSAE